MNNNIFKFLNLKKMSSTNFPDYVPLSLKGSGAYGYVIEAYDRKRDIRVAIKRTHKVGTKLSREYEILSELKDCKYIVKLLDVFYTTNIDKKIIQNLVFEFVPNGLEKYIENYRLSKKIIPIDCIKRLSKELLIGLNYCHKKNIVHRDLKPENILFTEDEHIKICDFGSSKNIDNKSNTPNKSTPYIVTRYYRAPELFFGKVDYDSKIDIFAAGCIISEFFTLTPLFPGVNDGYQILEYMNILGLPPDDYLKEFHLSKNIYDSIKQIENINTYPLNEILNPNNQYKEKDINEVSDLLYHMLCWDYKKRYNAEQCLNHPFLKDVKLDDNQKQV
jgi:glycogen synthase kinase 3 beta